MNNSPFHNSKQTPLPDANDIEQAAKGSQLPTSPASQPTGTKASPVVSKDPRKLGNIVLSLLMTVLVVGGLLATGLLFFMDNIEFDNPPAEQLD